MNLREGRTGRLECVFVIAISLITSGLFSFESDVAYSKGNSTYLSLPIALILAFGVYLLCALAMKNSGISDLKTLLTNAFGGIGGAIGAIYLALLLIITTCILLNRFLNVMSSYFYQTASYYSIMFYMLLVIAALSIMGFETVNRTSKVIGVVLLVVLALLLINSSSGYQSYKIYPIAGDGLGNLTVFSLKSASYFLPALIAVLITAKGMHGIGNAMKNTVVAVVIAILICGIVQLLLALSYTYEELAKLYLPIYRMSMITGTENFIVRFDKISAFVWLAGALLAGSFYVYSSSLLCCRAFRQKDIRPGAVTITMIIGILCILSHSGKHIVFDVINFISDYGAAFFALPLVPAAVITIIKTAVNSKKEA